MRHKLRHEALLVLLICSWIPVAVATVLIWVQMKSHLNSAERNHAQLLRAKTALNDEMLEAKNVADMLLASPELKNLMRFDQNMQLMAGNLLYGRISQLKKKMPEIRSYTILNDQLVPIFSFPTAHQQTVSARATAAGFSLQDQETLRYRCPIVYDHHEVLGPTTKSIGFLVLDIDLATWRNSLTNKMTINDVPAHPSTVGNEIKITGQTDDVFDELVLYLIVLGLVLVAATIIGLYLMRSRIVKPIVRLTEYVATKMNTTPVDAKHHEIAILQDSFETYVKYEEKLKSELLQQSTLAAIGRTTQMLAHDMRKPYTMVRGLLELVRITRKRSDLETLLRDLVPEIESSMFSVEGLLKEIMEVSSNKPLRMEVIDLSSLINAALQEAIRIEPNCEVLLEYMFTHQHALFVDPIKASRVISNVTSNAIEAMNGKGKLWFKTKEIDVEGRSMMAITIGNSGSYIPEDKQKSIFDPFFTEGKTSGTGLGLAIAKKLVVDHCGTIEVFSTKAVGTEFTITLPISESENDSFKAAPLQYSNEVLVAAPLTVGHRLEITSSEDRRLIDLIREIVNRSGKRISLLLADDESFYKKVMESHITESSLEDIISLRFVDTGEDALAAADAEHVDIFIIDVNFGVGRMNGFDLSMALRDSGNNANICIHSNQGVLEYRSKAIEAGADIFMLKPMSKAHFLSLIYSAVNDPGRYSTVCGSLLRKIE